MAGGGGDLIDLGCWWGGGWGRKRAEGGGVDTGGLSGIEGVGGVEGSVVVGEGGGGGSAGEVAEKSFSPRLTTVGVM